MSKLIGKILRSNDRSDWTRAVKVRTAWAAHDDRVRRDSELSEGKDLDDVNDFLDPAIWAEYLSRVENNQMMLAADSRYRVFCIMKYHTVNPKLSDVEHTNMAAEKFDIIIGQARGDSKDLLTERLAKEFAAWLHETYEPLLDKYAKELERTAREMAALTKD